MNASSSRSRTGPPADVEPRSRFLERVSCSAAPCRRASCELEPRPLAPHWTRALASSVWTLLAEPAPAVRQPARLLQAEALPAAGQGLGQELASSTQPQAAVRAAAVAEVLEGRVAGPPSPLGQTRASPHSGPCKRIPRAARSTNAAEHPQYPRLPMMHGQGSLHKTFFECRRPLFAHRPSAVGFGRGWDRTSDLPRVKRALSR